MSQCQAVVATKPRDHWLELCAKFQVPAAPCASYVEIGDPNSSVGRHLRANGYILGAKPSHADGVPGRASTGGSKDRSSPLPPGRGRTYR